MISHGKGCLKKWLKEFKKKCTSVIRSRKGFTFSELLVATVILLLSTSILVQTIAIAARNFDRVTQVSKAQQLCSILSGYVESELTYAKVTERGSSIKTNSDGAIVFSSESHNFGPNAAFYIKNGNALTPVTGSSLNIVGRLVESSDIYVNEGKTYFEIAGKEAYSGGGSDKYDLAAGMQKKYGSGVFTVDIVIKNKEMEDLASNSFVVIPALI